MAADPVFPSPSLHLETSKEGETVTILCHGRLVNDTTMTLQDEVRRLFSQAEFKTVVLDLSDVNYIDSSGIGALVGLFVSSKRAGKRLRVINLKDRVKEMLRVANLLNIFEDYGDSL
ncbi:MAG TPA: STAS domain-containing protein [Candidatus Acidoferrales bacterium]|nr:STAS domain-containing protein [Candidatus Acidoferrales bacterium]